MPKYCLFLVVFLVASCSAEPFEDYVGLWEEQDSQRHELLRISREGDSLMLQSVPVDERRTGKRVTSVVLGMDGGQLSINTAFSRVPLGLSEDNNSLRISRDVFRRVDESRIEELRAEVRQENVERDKNKALCASLKSEHSDKNNQLGTMADRKEKKRQSDALFAAYGEKAGAIPGCRLNKYW